ncbi:abortive infection family protein [Pseudoalteromonas sp. T1lg75]|uniref:abortive infection family protein n=1 Tax=Pseudoalteromonas sp. T1lg75 TaxID=2077102 RepID=UPI000CF62461|nr:abortive infection family protein [Pseudoalteromonas sp. T1lg75]
MEIEFINNDFERAEYFQSILLARATGGDADDNHYLLMRQHLMSNPNYAEILPRWVKTNRNLDQFWQYIKNKFPSYAERRQFLYDEINPLLEYLETKQTLPAAKSIDEVLSKFDSDGIHFAWQKALERKAQDPEGAITISRSILESVCKHILHAKNIDFNETNIELSELYKITAKELNLSPDQHSEKIFKQILGGCSGIVNGLGSLRNKHGDAHGSSPRAVKPKPRHAELAVNLAGTMALFLISTFDAIET